MNNKTFAQQIFYFSFGKINSKLDKSSSCLISRGSKKKKKKKTEYSLLQLPWQFTLKIPPFLSQNNTGLQNVDEEGREREGKRGKSDAPNVQFNVDSSDKHTVDSDEWSTRVYLTRLENEKQAETMTSRIDEAKRGIYWQRTMCA